MKLSKVLEYYTEEGEPIKCHHCGFSRIQENTMSTDGGYISEKEYVCACCRNRIGYWGYGSFDPCFMMSLDDELQPEGSFWHPETDELIDEATLIPVKDKVDFNKVKIL